MDIFGNGEGLPGDSSARQINLNEEIEFSYLDVVQKPVSKIEQKDPPRFLSSMRMVMAVVFVLLISRLFYLQVVEGAKNERLAENNRVRPYIIEATRGLISDNSGGWLARNKPDFVLVVYPADLPVRSNERAASIQKIAEVAELPLSEVEKAVTQKGNYFFDSAVLKDDLSHDDALLYRQKIANTPGLAIVTKTSREYAIVPGVSHLLGYTGLVSSEDVGKDSQYLLSDRIGKIGLEKQYEQYLKGVHGVEQVEVDSKGTVARTLIEPDNKKAIAGNDISLYLDRGLQEKSAEALRTGIESARQLTGNSQINSGVVGVMDVKTGGMLSLVSLPDYNNNLFSTKISSVDYDKLANDTSLPLFNRATNGTYPPGSIIKLVMAAAGLSEGAISVNTAYDTPSAITIGDYNFPDWKDHGVTDIKRAIAESNNIFFYAIGGGYDKVRGIGIDKIKKYWQAFGLGEDTGIDLPAEASGFLPDPIWKEKIKREPWYLGDTYHVSIGQGDLLVTPLQMLRITATIANGGKLLRPQLVKKITSQNGEVVREFGPNVERENFIDSGIIRTIGEGMRLTVTGGSAQNLKDLPVSVAGKTGTAQFFDNQKTHAWFEAYAPYENPQIAIIVLIEGGGGGHEVAAPVAKDILNYYFTRPQAP